jgi:hypothetical protein
MHEAERVVTYLTQVWAHGMTRITQQRNLSAWTNPTFQIRQERYVPEHTILSHIKDSSNLRLKNFSLFPQKAKIPNRFSSLVRYRDPILGHFASGGISMDEQSNIVNGTALFDAGYNMPIWTPPTLHRIASSEICRQRICPHLIAAYTAA